MIVMCREHNIKETARVVPADVIIDQSHSHTSDSVGPVQRSHLLVVKDNEITPADYRMERDRIEIGNPAV